MAAPGLPRRSGAEPLHGRVVQDLASFLRGPRPEDLVVGEAEVRERRAQGLDGQVRSEHAAVATEQVDDALEPRPNGLDVPRAEDRAEGVEAGRDVRQRGERPQALQVELAPAALRSPGQPKWSTTIRSPGSSLASVAIRSSWSALASRVATSPAGMSSRSPSRSGASDAARRPDAASSWNPGTRRTRTLVTSSSSATRATRSAKPGASGSPSVTMPTTRPSRSCRCTQSMAATGSAVPGSDQIAPPMSNGAVALR